MTTFQVYGTPAPQGSKRGFVNRKTGGVILVESSDKVKPWREAVKHATLEAIKEAYDGPVGLTITFYLARPKGHYGSGKNAGKIKDSAPLYPGVRPDLSKLIRSTEDGMTEGGAYKDDSQVTGLLVHKVYADDRPPGATISIYKMA